MVRKVVLAIFLSVVCSTLASEPPVPEYEPIELDKCLAWVVHDEARGEPLKGARAVLDVVQKRMDDSGKSACEVVAEKGQFSGYSKKALKKVPEEAYERLELVLRMKPVCKDCKYFHATYVLPAWATKLKRAVKVRKHIFYKERQK